MSEHIDELAVELNRRTAQLPHPDTEISPGVRNLCVFIKSNARRLGEHDPNELVALAFNTYFRRKPWWYRAWRGIRG